MSKPPIKVFRTRQSLDATMRENARRWQAALNRNAADVTDMIDFDEALRQVIEAHERTGKPVRK